MVRGMKEKGWLGIPPKKWEGSKRKMKVDFYINRETESFRKISIMSAARPYVV